MQTITTKSITKSIKQAQKCALDYYGVNEEDANDMLMGINFVISFLNENIKTKIKPYICR